MRRSNLFISIILIACVSFGVADLAFAGKKKASGKELYKEFCKPCHDKESAHGEYTPMTLIQDQWERFFEEKYVETHKTVVDEAHEGKVVTDAISADDLAKIKKFAVDHAADSEQPMTCG